MLALDSLMDLSQSALIFDLSFQYLILRLLILVCTQFHHLFIDRPLRRILWGLLLNTWLVHVNYRSQVTFASCRSDITSGLRATLRYPWTSV
jgi:hypothetical protein